MVSIWRRGEPPLVRHLDLRIFGSQRRRETAQDRAGARWYDGRRSPVRRAAIFFSRGQKPIPTNSSAEAPAQRNTISVVATRPCLIPPYWVGGVVSR